MNIFRRGYVEQLIGLINQQQYKMILVHGGRGSGKTTILHQIMSSSMIHTKKYYFSFEDEIVAKKFISADDFKGYMQIKYGIDFSLPHILLLNEIQYSKNFLKILDELLHDANVKTMIIATGVIPIHHEDYDRLSASDAVMTLSIYPLGFFDFLEYKGLHTTYLSIDNPSSIIFKELQGLLDEYLIRGGYPEVIKTIVKERREFALKSIIQKVYDKDVGFSFTGDELFVFQDLLEQLCYISMQGFKYKAIAQQLEISIPLLKKYIAFLRDNCLIDTLSYYYSDKKKELCHQDTITISDMGIFSYITGNFGSKHHNLIAIKNFVYNEIKKSLPAGCRCMTYQKINNSKIDFVIEYPDKTITVIVVSESSSNKPPKIYKGFNETYGHLVRRYVKTTPLLAHKGELFDKEYLCVPHFMISSILGS